MINKHEFISFMIQSEVLRFGDFVTKSGRRSPYFINTGNYQTGGQLSVLGRYYADLIHKTCGDHFDVLFGPAYKGIPLACAASMALQTAYHIDKPYCFNRKEAKDHGEGGVFIGHKPRPGDKVLFLDDVITAGTAIRESLPLIEATGAEVAHMFISVDRGEKGRGEGGKTAVQEIEAECGFPVHPLVSIYDILDYLKTRPGEGENLVANIEKYLSNYSS
jgi:orotate phosphoribosyltransferase